MDNELGNTLLVMARNAIADKLGGIHVSEPIDRPQLAQPGAVFVTLTKTRELRGCIGSLEAWRPLRDDVVANARAAAFNDPRFAPVQAGELADIRVEVSLLSPAEPISFIGEDDAIGQLRPNIDGVILECGRHRGTFLPQVWESLPESHQFMAQLKRKAGLPPDFWSTDVKVSRYCVEKWKEQT